MVWQWKTSIGNRVHGCQSGCLVALDLIKVAMLALWYVFVTADGGLCFNGRIAAGWKQNDVARPSDLRDADIGSHAFDFHVGA